MSSNVRRRYSPSFHQKQFHPPFNTETPKLPEPREIYYGKNSPGFSQRLLRDSQNFQSKRLERNLDKSGKGNTLEITFQNPTLLTTPRGKAPQQEQKKRYNFRINYEYKDDMRNRVNSPHNFQDLHISQILSNRMLQLQDVSYTATKMQENYITLKSPRSNIINRLLFNQIKTRQSLLKDSRMTLKTTQDDYQRDKPYPHQIQYTQQPYLYFEKKVTTLRTSESPFRRERLVKTGRTTRMQQKNLKKESSQPDLKGWEMEDQEDDLYIKL